MAKSLSSILSQIERLQKEAAAIQSELVNRIRGEIAKYGLTAEQLFGGASSRQPVKGAKATGAKSKTVKSKGAASRPPKYADGGGNVWGGIGKRPEWLRQALAAGKALEEFLAAQSVAPAAKERATRKQVQTPGSRAAAKPKALSKKRTAAKKPAAGKTRAKKAAPPAAAS